METYEEVLKGIYADLDYMFRMSTEEEIASSKSEYNLRAAEIWEQFERWCQELYSEYYGESESEEDWDEADDFTEKNRSRAVRIRKANEDQLRRSWKKAQIARAKAKEIKRTKRELRHMKTSF